MAQFSNGINDQYLDRNGLDYLLQELDKKYSDGGNVDLSNYYTKSQVDTLLSSIGEGKNGVGIQSVTLVNYELIVTLTDTTVINLGNVRGAQGIQGVKGDTGEKGSDGANGLNGTNGTNGSDGRGIISIIKTGTVDLVDTYTITYTDNTTSTFTVTNGSGGTGGSGSSLDTYSTNETAIGTWIDGKTIYRKCYSITGLSAIQTNDFIGMYKLVHGIQNVETGLRVRIFIGDSQYDNNDGFYANGIVTSTNVATLINQINTYIVRQSIYGKMGTSMALCWIGKSFNISTGYIALEYTKTN